MDSKQLKILIVDDDKETRELYAEVFAKNGFLVSEAEDGLEGLKKANQDVPNVIFTGIIMPKMDGFTMMGELQKNVLTSKIPVVISSHLGREEDKKRAQELGAKDFFIRGFDTPNEVVTRVRALFDDVYYRLKFDSGDLDAPKIIQELNFGSEFKCKKCGGDMILKLKLVDANREEFSAKFICEKCNQ